MPGKRQGIPIEVKALETFLTIVQEGSISGAADELGLAQPTVSRQLIELEDHLGTKLLVRSRTGVALTKDGMLLARRASEIIDLVRTTETEIYASRGQVAGSVRIGAAESQAFEYVARTIAGLRKLYPELQFRIVSTTADDAVERIENGHLDCALIVGDAPKGFHQIDLPFNETPGLLMRKNHPLAKKKTIEIDDLFTTPLLLSQRFADNKLALLPGVDPAKLDVVATFNLNYNASILVRSGLGCAITLDGLKNAPGLIFRPINVESHIPVRVIWKASQAQSRACEAFLQQLPLVALSARPSVGKQNNHRRRL